MRSLDVASAQLLSVQLLQDAVTLRVSTMSIKEIIFKNSLKKRYIYILVVYLFGLEGFASFPRETVPLRRYFLVFLLEDEEDMWKFVSKPGTVCAHDE